MVDHSQVFPAEAEELMTHILRGTLQSSYGSQIRDVHSLLRIAQNGGMGNRSRLINAQTVLDNRALDAVTNYVQHDENGQKLWAELQRINPEGAGVEALKRRKGDGIATHSQLVLRWTESLGDMESPDQFLASTDSLSPPAVLMNGFASDTAAVIADASGDELPPGTFPTDSQEEMGGATPQTPVKEKLDGDVPDENVDHTFNNNVPEANSPGRWQNMVTQGKNFVGHEHTQHVGGGLLAVDGARRILTSKDSETGKRKVGRIAFGIVETAVGLAIATNPHLGAAKWALDALKGLGNHQQRS